MFSKRNRWEGQKNLFKRAQSIYVNKFETNFIYLLHLPIILKSWLLRNLNTTRMMWKNQLKQTIIRGRQQTRMRSNLYTSPRKMLLISIQQNFVEILLCMWITRTLFELYHEKVGNIDFPSCICDSSRPATTTPYRHWMSRYAHTHEREIYWILHTFTPAKRFHIRDDVAFIVHSSPHRCVCARTRIQTKKRNSR